MEGRSFIEWLNPYRWSGFAEAVFAMVFILMLGTTVLILTIPWLLVITVPCGVLMMLHGYWRDNVRVSQ